MISELRDTFDYVVLDTPPVGPVVDAITVANLADKTIFVVEWAATPRELVETAIRQVSAHKRVAGAVFNRVKQSHAKNMVVHIITETMQHYSNDRNRTKAWIETFPI